MKESKILQIYTEKFKTVTEDMFAKILLTDQREQFLENLFKNEKFKVDCKKFAQGDVGFLECIDKKYKCLYEPGDLFGKIFKDEHHDICQTKIGIVKVVIDYTNWNSVYIQYIPWRKTVAGTTHMDDDYLNPIYDSLDKSKYDLIKIRRNSQKYRNLFNQEDITDLFK